MRLRRGGHVTALQTTGQYYADTYVRTRIAEYCGGSGGGEPTCVFVAELRPGHHATWARAPQYPVDALPQLLDRGWDLSRSLSDRESLVVYFEIEIGDPDNPADALLNPRDAFERLEPAYQAVRDELSRLQLPLLDVMTGRGYHFSGRVPLTSPTVTRLASYAPGTGTHADRAFTGLGMLLEYIGHNVYRGARGATPVVFNGVEIGRGARGREAVSIDLSAYGDPIRDRQMRVAFGTYQSHRIRPDIFGEHTARSVPVLVAVPRRGRPLEWMLNRARTLDDALALARFEEASLPEVDDGLRRAIDEYAASELCAIHQDFYRSAPHGPDRWRETYDRVAPTDVLPCAGRALRWPNDLLLKPTVLQHLTRYLMAEGWAPPHIAGLVWSKYARDFGWGDRWTRLDARRRAEFDVRVFASAIQSGVDRGVDFNCVSAQEKGLCPRSGCQHDLRHDRKRLLEGVAV
jgi:hypothetical protein